VLRHWDPIQAVAINPLVERLSSSLFEFDDQARDKLHILIYQARYDVALKLPVSRGVAVASGQPFRYFDAVRQTIETATSDLFIVDPYLNADFVSDYLPYVKSGIPIRLLANKYISQIIPAARKFASENKNQVSVRSTGEIHDRYLSQPWGQEKREPKLPLSAAFTAAYCLCLTFR
jgi:hypothetical protein